MLDDNLVESALYGLVDAGVSVPRDVEVVAHANFPGAHSGPTRFTRVGYDARMILALAFSALRDLRLGRSVKDVVVPALFAEEVGEPTATWIRPDVPPSR